MAGAVDRDPIDDAIGACKVHVLENIRAVRLHLLDLTELGFATFANETGLAGENVTNIAVAKLLEGDRLGGEHVVHDARVVGGGTRAERQGTDAVGVTETEDAKASNHCNAGIATVASLVHALQCQEDVLLVHTSLASLVQLVGEDVEHEFAV